MRPAWTSRINVCTDIEPHCCFRYSHAAFCVNSCPIIYSFCLYLSRRKIRQFISPAYITSVLLVSDSHTPSSDTKNGQNLALDTSLILYSLLKNCANVSFPYCPRVISIAWAIVAFLGAFIDSQNDFVP